MEPPGPSAESSQAHDALRKRDDNWDIETLSKVHRTPPARMPITPSKLMPAWAGRLAEGAASYFGLMCMIAASMIHSVQALLVKLIAADEHVSAIQALLIRSLLVCALAIGFALPRGAAIMGAPANRRLLLARGVIGFIALSSYMQTLTMMPMRDAVVINFTGPIFTALLAALFLGEPWGMREGAATVFSFFGVLLISRPPIFFGRASGAADGAADGAGDDGEEARRLWAVGVGLVGAGCTGAAYTLVRAVGKLGEHPLAPVVYLSSVSVAGSSAALLLHRGGGAGGWVWPSTREWVHTGLLGCLAFLAQILVTKGLQLEKASRATSMQYIKVLGTVALGVVFLHEELTTTSVTGGLLIICSAGVIASESRAGV